MPCFSPIVAYRSSTRNESGKRSMVFNRREALNPDEVIKLQCGRCIGCRLEYSRQWAMRCMHELKMHDESCYLTLTYNDQECPKDGGLRKEDLQKFFKRLRKKIEPIKIRYYAVGEYGDKTNRPHYHAILYGYDFQDKKFHTTSKGHNIYISDCLDSIWKLGDCYLGNVTFESAAYVARYCTKKINGSAKEELCKGKVTKPYERMDLYTGELFEVQPEFAVMSRKPGIGVNWYEEFKSDCFPSNFIIVRGKKMLPPRYYMQKYSETNPLEADEIKERCKAYAKQNAADNTYERLRVRETVKLAAIKSLRRDEV